MKQAEAELKYETMKKKKDEEMKKQKEEADEKLEKVKGALNKASSLSALQSGIPGAPALPGAQ